MEGMLHQYKNETSAYMVFHAEGLAGIELHFHCSADRSASPRL